ncbi:MAG: hypothetical protein K2M07_05855 [Muribaculaceae bacterium]|nr:hypothetical protein [Muribaculaceae bacterium]
MGSSNVDQCKAGLEQAKRNLEQKKRGYDDKISRATDPKVKKKLREDKADDVKRLQREVERWKKQLADAREKEKKKGK